MISKYAIVETDLIGNNVRVGEFAIIRSGVVIGDNVIIHPHVVINSNVHLGNGVEVFSGALIGKEPKNTGALVRTLKFERYVVIGDGCSIGPHAVIYYDVRIGDNTLIGDGASIREGCVIGSRCIIGRYVTLQFDVSVGDFSRVIDHSTLAGRTQVGNRVFISFGVLSVGDNTFGRDKYEESRMGGPVIEDDVSIGAGALLNARVHIGKGAIVGAGALVTHDVEPETVVMGIPARFVRRLTNEA